MSAETAFQSYLEGALETFGIEADEVERMVMAGVWSIYQPAMDALRDADFEDVELELHADLSQPPTP
jgi:hypothetical protein